MSRKFGPSASRVYIALGFAFFFTLGLVFGSGLHALAGETDSAGLEGKLSVIDWPVLTSGEHLKEKPEHCRIFQADAAPIGDRKPFLLIHGGGSEYKPMLHWDKVIERFNQDPRFHNSYKIYLLRYDSTRLLEDIMPECKTAIRSLYDGVGKKPVTVMALSMGGNIVELAMEDESIEQAVERVIAMGTPFHGSPLFSSDWFQYSLYKSKFLPVFRILDSIDYRVYFSWHKNYQQDLKWDDADDLVPQVGKFRSKLPLGPKGILTIERDTSSILAHANADKEIDKKKFVVYAGYLLNEYVLNKERDRLRSVLLKPFRFLGTQMKAQVGQENAALLVLNREISKIDAGPSGSQLGKGQHVYALNDGITPVSSALFLPSKVLRTHLLLRESDLLGILPFIDTGNARCFRNIDHLTYVEGRPPHHGSPLVRDSLHPQEGPHTIFDWMLAEVLQVKVTEVEATVASANEHSQGASSD